MFSKEMLNDLHLQLERKAETADDASDRADWEEAEEAGDSGEAVLETKDLEDVEEAAELGGDADNLGGDAFCWYDVSKRISRTLQKAAYQGQRDPQRCPQRR